MFHRHIAFATVLLGVPAGWQWQPGRAKARLVVGEEVHRSGKRSIQIENDSPQEPHVYSGPVTRIACHPGHRV